MYLLETRYVILSENLRLKDDIVVKTSLSLSVQWFSAYTQFVRVCQNNESLPPSTFARSIENSCSQTVHGVDDANQSSKVVEDAGSLLTESFPEMP